MADLGAEVAAVTAACQRLQASMDEQLASIHAREAAVAAQGVLPDGFSV